MKTSKFALLICALAVSALNAGADERGRGHGGDRDRSDRWTNGTETVEARVALLPTDNAPADARGRAGIESENEQGTVTTVLELAVQGLAEGDYAVAIVLASDGSIVDLGQVTVKTPTNTDRNGRGARPTRSRDQGGDATTTRGRAKLEIPADIDPLDIARVVVADADGNELLAGDVGSSSSAVQYQATVSLKPGPRGPRARGTVSFQSTLDQGQQTIQMNVSGSGLPANTTLNLQVNGRTVSRPKTSARGTLTLQSDASNLLPLQSVDLKDARGRVVAGARF